MPQPKAKQVLMNLDAFVEWLERTQPGAFVEGKTGIQACHCGDINCHGWRVVRFDNARAASGE